MFWHVALDATDNDTWWMVLWRYEYCHSACVCNLLVRHPNHVTRRIGNACLSWSSVSPFSLRSTILKPNSSACFCLNNVMCLVDLDMAIAWANLPLVWDLYVFTFNTMAFLVCLEVQMFQKPKKYMRWPDTHFLPPRTHIVHICLILCLKVALIWCTLCV